MRTAALGAESAFCDLPHRVCVAPDYGRFEPAPPQVVTAEGELVRLGEVLGEVVRGRQRATVYAPCDAWVLDHLVVSGERVRPGTPLVHLWEL